MLKMKTPRPLAATAAVMLALLGPAVLSSGCGTPDPAEAPSEVPAGTVDDWPAIRERGVIRFVRHGFEAFETLPSQGLSKERYHFLADGFAERYGLRAEWIVSPDVDGLLVALEEGRADVAVATLTVTETREERVAFTVPLTISREWVIGRGEGVFGVPAGTSYEESLAAHYPDAPRAPVAGVFDPLNIRALIEAGAFDATIMDEAAARVVVRTSSEIRKLAELPYPQRIAWAVRRGNPELREALDDFLTEHHTVADEPAEIRDWEAIRASGQPPAPHHQFTGDPLPLAGRAARVRVRVGATVRGEPRPGSRGHRGPRSPGTRGGTADGTRRPGGGRLGGDARPRGGRPALHPSLPGDPGDLRHRGRTGHAPERPGRTHGDRPGGDQLSRDPRPPRRGLRGRGIGTLEPTTSSKGWRRERWTSPWWTATAPNWRRPSSRG